MAVIDIKVAGSSIAVGGGQLWAESASITEDATSLSLADSFGGTGSTSVTTDRGDGLTYTQGKELELVMDDAGSVKGAIVGLSDADGLVTLTGSTALSKLNRKVKVNPVTTTVGDALAAIFTACKLTTGQFSINSTIAARSIVLPGWEDNALQMLKEFAAAERFEIAPVNNIITVRPIGQIPVSLDGHTSLTESTGEGSSGLYVETFRYGHRAITAQIVYPPATYDADTGGSTAAGWSPNADVIEVTPGQPVVLEVPIMASLTSVQQPTCVDWVERNATGSVYCVTTNEGVRAVSPSTWTSRGGKVTVQVMRDTSTLKITVDAGWNDINGAPYRLMLDDGKTEYSTLRITGTGVAWTKTRMRQRTGVSENDTDNEIASSTDSIFVRTEAIARTALLEQAEGVGSAIPSLAGSIANMPVLLGQRAGAIVATDHAKYRIRTATTDPYSVSFSADAHTTVGDHNAATAGLTVAQVNAKWANQQVQAHNLTPLG